MHDVFISYSSKETEKAEAVRNILEKNRIACWMAPRDIPGGSNYTEEIPAAIQGCQVFLLILSENAQKSTWVPRELEAAVNCGKVIIPFMLEEFQLNNEFNFLLGAKHRYAAYQNNAEIMQILIERIRAIIGGGPIIDPPEPGTEKEPEEEKQSKEEKQIQKEKQMAEPEHTAKEKREQPSEKKPEISLVEIPDRTPCCPSCGRELIQIVKPYDGEELYTRYFDNGRIFGFCLAIIIGIVGGIAAGVTYNFRDGEFLLDAFGFFALSVIFTFPMGALVGHFIGEKKQISLWKKKGINPYILHCKKCKKQFSQKED